MAVTSSIEIATPPEVVRAKFLDFESLPKYHKDFFGAITPLGPNKSIEPGDKIRVEFSAAGQKMDAKIIENSPNHFEWVGSIPFIFTGSHSFMFEPSTSIPGGTKFTQLESFSGVLAFLMGDNIMARQVGFATKTIKGWERYNEDFKKWCEREG